MFKNKKILITAGPTIEKIDPVRYISNFSSGKQGYAFAEEFANLGAIVYLVSGPVNIKPPINVELIKVESADQMHNACLGFLPVDIAVFTAAVSDYRPSNISNNKIKKEQNVDEISLKLVKNPDILYNICHHELRPKIVIGFAAETENMVENARNKLRNKKCDYIVANNVSRGKVFGEDKNKITLFSKDSVIEFNDLSKLEVAKHVIKNIKNIG